jgi:hypothetical protein
MEIKGTAASLSIQLRKPSRPQAAKSSEYKIKNWKEYNQALKDRGL